MRCFLVSYVAVAWAAPQYVEELLSLEYEHWVADANYAGWVDTEGDRAVDVGAGTVTSICKRMDGSAACAETITARIAEEAIGWAMSRSADANGARAQIDGATRGTGYEDSTLRMLSLILAGRESSDVLGVVGNAPGLAAALLSMFGNILSVVVESDEEGLRRFYGSERVRRGDYNVLFVQDCQNMPELLESVELVIATRKPCPARFVRSLAARGKLRLKSTIDQKALLIGHVVRSKRSHTRNTSFRILGDGAWDAESHLASMHGLNFDEPLASFVARALSPRSVLEFGAGLGLYVDYMCRVGVEQVVGIEPRPMPAPRCGELLMGDASTTAGRQDITAVISSRTPHFDVVLSIEVLEHIPTHAHKPILEFLARFCDQYFLFSASSRSDSPGHIATRPQREWQALAEGAGFRFLPQITEWLRPRLSIRNQEHRDNLLVFASNKSRDIVDSPRQLPLSNQVLIDTILPIPPLAGELDRASVLWPELAAARTLLVGE